MIKRDKLGRFTSTKKTTKKAVAVKKTAKKVATKKAPAKKTATKCCGKSCKKVK